MTLADVPVQGPDLPPRWITYEEAERRWPRLLRCCSWVGILSQTEAACCLRDYANARNEGWRDLLRHGGGEAVNHYGGPLALVSRAATADVRGIMRREARRGLD